MCNYTLLQCITCNYTLSACNYTYIPFLHFPFFTFLEEEKANTNLRKCVLDKSYLTNVHGITGFHSVTIFSKTLSVGEEHFVFYSMDFVILNIQFSNISISQFFLR